MRYAQGLGDRNLVLNTVFNFLPVNCQLALCRSINDRMLVLNLPGNRFA